MKLQDILSLRKSLTHPPGDDPGIKTKEESKPNDAIEDRLPANSNDTVASKKSTLESTSANSIKEEDRDSLFDDDLDDALLTDPLIFPS